MLTDFQTVSELARKNASRMLRALAEVTQTRVAEQLKTSESTISRWKEPGAEIEKTAMALDAMGLKVVGKDEEFYPREYIESLRSLAGIATAIPCDKVKEFIG